MRMTPRKKRDMVSALKRGWPYVAISKELGIEYKMVNYYAHKLGLREKNPSYDKSEEPRCKKCEILLKYGGAGTEVYCEGCANDLAII